MEDKVSWTYLTGWIMVICLILYRTWGEEWWKVTLLGLPYADCHRVTGFDALAWGAISCVVPIFDGKSLVHLVVNLCEPYLSFESVIDRINTDRAKEK